MPGAFDEASAIEIADDDALVGIAESRVERCVGGIEKLDIQHHIVGQQIAEHFDVQRAGVVAERCGSLPAVGRPEAAVLEGFAPPFGSGIEIVASGGELGVAPKEHSPAKGVVVAVVRPSIAVRIGRERIGQVYRFELVGERVAIQILPGIRRIGRVQTEKLFIFVTHSVVIRIVGPDRQSQTCH